MTVKVAINAEIPALKVLGRRHSAGRSPAPPGHRCPPPVETAAQARAQDRIGDPSLSLASPVLAQRWPMDAAPVATLGHRCYLSGGRRQHRWVIDAVLAHLAGGTGVGGAWRGAVPRRQRATAAMRERRCCPAGSGNRTGGTGCGVLLGLGGGVWLELLAGLCGLG